MKRILILILPVILFSCTKEKGHEYITTEKAASYFATVKDLCDKDNGALWGENLYGPIMLVDYNTRKIFSNVQDAEGLLKPKDNIFTGTYPRESIISNYAVNYGGTMFAMANLPREEDKDRIVTRSIHALFHCYQVRHGIDSREFNTNFLDERRARIYMKLEWKALERAIRSLGETRRQAIRDALVFRAARREMYPEFTEEENRLEDSEGLTTFTVNRIFNPVDSAYNMSMLETLHRIYNFRSYSHSFGSASGSLYAYLIHDTGFDLSTIDKPDVDLGKLTGELYDITMPEISRDIAGSLAFNYDIDIIQTEEKDREHYLKEGFRRRIAPFTERPFVLLELESPNFSFEPEDIDPVDSLGVIYKSLRVSDNWGKLTVDEGGCLISNNLKYLRVPARDIKTDKNHISGDGWHLILDSNWEFVKYEDNFLVRKVIP